MVNPNMEWYCSRDPSDIPEINVTLMDQPERGVIGLGEPPTISTAAAIANAVANATGVRDAQPAAHARQVLRRPRAGEGRRDSVKAFAYVNSRQREGSRRRRSAPSAAGSCRSRAGRICSR